MNWDTKFWKPVRLKDGRAMATLGEARTFVSAHQERGARNAEWQSVSELLGRAAYSNSLADDALSQLIRALKVEGLV
jgi:hypothetical protein